MRGLALALTWSLSRVSSMVQTVDSATTRRNLGVSDSYVHRSESGVWQGAAQGARRRAWVERARTLGARERCASVRIHPT